MMVLTERKCLNCGVKLLRRWNRWFCDTSNCPIDEVFTEFDAFSKSAIAGLFRQAVCQIENGNIINLAEIENSFAHIREMARQAVDKQDEPPRDEPPR